MYRNFVEHQRTHKDVSFLNSNIVSELIDDASHATLT